MRTLILLALALSLTLPATLRLIHNAAASSPAYGYSRQWGSFGGPSSPNGVALDSSGNLYIADSQNYAVGKIAPNGTLLKIWGSKGTAPGQFNSPFGIATDLAGNIFVTDSNNNNVQKFNSSGTLLASWNSNGTSNGMFTHPLGIAVNASGYVYVVDSGNKRVGIFRNNGVFVEYFRLGLPGNFTMPEGIAIDPLQGFVYVDDDNFAVSDTYSGNVTQFTMTGSQIASWGGPLLGPGGMTIDSSSNIYVADHLKDMVLKFNNSGKLLLFWGSPGNASGKFSNPTGLANDNQGNVLVSDSSNLNVQKFLVSGNTATYIASFAYQRTGAFSTPYGTALDGLGNIYIADQDNNRVQKFNTLTGRFLGAWGTFGALDGQFNSPSGVAVDHNGNVYVVDSNNTGLGGRVQKFFPDGTFIKAWSSLGPSGKPFVFPSGIAVDQSNYVYVTDYDNNSVDKFDSSGNFILAWGTTGQGNGQFNGPLGIAVDSLGSVYVSDSRNNRVEKFTSSGAFSAIVGNGQFNQPEGLALDSANNLYVADTYNSRIDQFALNGTFLNSFGTPGPGPGQLANPQGVVVDSMDSVYVTDSNPSPGTANNRVEVFAPFHDVATTGLGVSRKTAYSGVIAQPVTVNVTVSDFGLSPETVWVAVYANTTLIANLTSITLSPGQSRGVSFPWSAGLLTKGIYKLTSRVQVVLGDPNTVNNTFQGGFFYVRLNGDVNGDCKVDIVDLSSVGAAFASLDGGPGWNVNADLNNDRVVNIIDLVLVAENFGKSC